MARNRLIPVAMIICFMAAILIVGGGNVLADAVVVDLRDFDEGDLAVDGFELKSKTRLSIQAIGAELKHSDDMYAYAWILDADSRESMWVLSSEDTKRHKGKRHIRAYEDEITLPKGRYEVYYYAGYPYEFFIDGSLRINGLKELFGLIGDIFDDDDKSYDEYYIDGMEDLMLTIKAPEGSFTKFNPVEEMKAKAVVEFVRPENDFYDKQGFTLTKDISLKIIAIGEYPGSDRVFVDYGWIIDADSRKKVWQMNKWNTSWAGGGRKNRGFVGEEKFKAGNYIAYFATDDSHTFGDWNVAPPYDPLHYGLGVYLTDEKDRKYVKDYKDEFFESAVISLTKVRDDQYRQKGFSIKKETDFHIVALGEFGYQDEFVDYGWIEDIASGDIVWEMSEDNTEHAGGGKKNRKFDGVVTFPAGDYFVYYVSDGSHAYRDWNTSPPIERELWGITLYGVGKDFDKDDVNIFDEMPRNDRILVDLTGIGNDEEVRERFTLDSEQKVRIFALGEGKDGRMFDYGWIEDAETGEIIWEMTYRKTRHAGGAYKNRKVNARILLDKGDYYAYFLTDGSHSFPDFNESRPMSPHKWGIMIMKTE